MKIEEFVSAIRMLSEGVRLKNCGTMLCAAFFILQSSFFISCRQADDVVEIVPARHWVEKTVAVVAPIGDAATKTRLERTAEWFQQNLHEAQLHDTLAIRLKLEWHDELSEDLTALSLTLADREDVIAVIGPFANENVALFAPACMKTMKPLVAPTATSECPFLQKPPQCPPKANRPPAAENRPSSASSFLPNFLSLCVHFKFLTQHCLGSMQLRGGSPLCYAQ